MENKNIPLIYKETWMGISTLTSLEDKKLEAEIERLQSHINNRCHNATIDLLSERFVPDINVRNLIIKIANNITIKAHWNEFIKDFNYSRGKKSYSKLGYIILRAELNQNQQAESIRDQVRPELLQQIVFLIWYDMISAFKDSFLFDVKTVPHAINVCSGLKNSSEIEWTKANIQQNKQELGKWVELYSGQFPDYHDTLYERRIKTNLSNRTSEMHFIKQNSGLIYMKPENYNMYFIKDDRTPDSTGYMFNTVIKTVFQLRCIGFAMVIVSDEIDIDTQQLTTKAFTDKKPSLIKEDLEKTNRLKMILQKMLAPIFTDLTRSHRQHYHSLLKHCFEINEFEKNWEMILQKLDSNFDELNSIFLDKQESASKRQEKILNIVNIILGAGIVFEVINYIWGDNQDVFIPIVAIIGGFLALILLSLLGKLYIPNLIKKLRRKKDEKNEKKEKKK